MSDHAPELPSRERRKAETPAQRLARLERDIARAKLAVKEQEKQAHAIIGMALVAEARTDSVFSEKIREVLARRVTGKSAQADIAAIFSE